MVGRDRRQARRQERGEERQAFGVGGSATRYRMREKLLSIGGDSWIEDGSGDRAFRVNGKALRARRTLVIEDPGGRELLKIQDRPVRVRDVMEIEDAEGGSAAHVRKAAVAPLRQRYTIDLAAGGQWQAQGNILDHEFEIDGDQGKVAEVSKRWFRVRDTYGVEIRPGHNDALLLAVTVCLDEMARGG